MNLKLAEYWSNLTPETAFFARVYVDYCKENKDEVRLEAVLPVVTSIAFQIQHEFNTFIDVLDEYDTLKTSRNVDDEELIQSEERKISKQLIISELLKMAANLDYSDEIGRRKTFQLVRESKTFSVYHFSIFLL
jgi:condensin complex subunit 3